MKQSNPSSRLLAASATLALLAALVPQAHGFFGIGGCPVKYPVATNPFGTSGAVPNGQYYSHFLDDQYWTFLETIMVPQLPSMMRPRGSRRFHECNRAVI
jgi:hypothetical protein